MKKLLFVLFVLISVSSLMAQQGFDRCGTMEMDALVRAKYPSLGSLEDFETWLAPKIKAYKIQQEKDGFPEQVYDIPVVIHIIHNSAEPVGTDRNITNAQAISQINVLNEDFRKLNGDFSTAPGVFQTAGADCEINFCLSGVDPLGNVMAEEGINRISATSIPGGFNTASTNSIDGYTKAFVNATIKPNTQWDPDKYFNIWVLHLGENAGNQLLGYAQFPNSSGLPGSLPNSAANTDGVVMWYRAFGNTGNVSPSYSLGRTATHETGHWLGLRHIWGDATCGDDYCNDTPTQTGPNFGCQTHPSPTCGNSGDMFMNFMDYGNDNCITLFTQDQKARMVTVMQNSPRRGTLATSNVCRDCTILQSYSDNDTPNLYPNTTGTPPWGWMSGHNSYDDRAKCEKIYIGLTTIAVEGVEVYFAKAYDATGSGTIDITVHGAPFIDVNGIVQSSTLEHTQSYPISSINTGMTTPTYFQFSSPVLVSDQIIVCVEFSANGNPQDSIAVYSTTDGEGTGTDAFEKWSNGTFIEVSEGQSWGMDLNFLISAKYCNPVGIEEVESEEALINIYPNPSTGLINIEFEDAEQIEVYNLLGGVVYSERLNNDQYTTTIDLSDQPNGVYLVTVKTANSFSTKKLILTN